MAGFKRGFLTRKRKWFIHKTLRETSISGNISQNSAVFNGMQETTSEGHRWPPRKGENFVDIGGAFLTRKSYLKGIKAVDVYGVGNNPLPGLYDYAFIKGAIPNFPNTLLTTLPAQTDDTTLTVEGTRALNQMRPTAPLSGLGVTIGELREGVPKLIGAGALKALMGDARGRHRVLKEGSDEYLNWEFGWKPLVSDLMDASRAVQQSEKIINQLYRDSGRDVRRRFGFPVTKETTIEEVGGAYPNPPGPTYLWDASGRTYLTTTTMRRVWVSGMCRYYVPPADDLRGRIQRQAMEANRLYGLRPDPEVLWNLAPWTWLADWVSDTGALIGNLSSFAFDGLVWKYAYLMEHTIETRKYDLVGARTYTGASPQCSVTVVRESKRRVTATPFGFGLDLDSFSLRQWSILAALGISRGNL